MLSKKLFVKAIDSIKKQKEVDSEFCEAMSKIFKDAYGPFMYDNDRLVEMVIQLMSESFGMDAGQWNDITYFIHELDYGSRWKPGMVTDENGQDIDMSTAEKLYDYLALECESSKMWLDKI